MPSYDGLIGGNRIEPGPSLGWNGLEGIARNDLLRLSVQSCKRFRTVKAADLVRANRNVRGRYQGSLVASD